jgi:hypothetical protein
MREMPVRKTVIASETGRAAPVSFSVWFVLSAGWLLCRGRELPFSIPDLSIWKKGDIHVYFADIF